MSETQAIVVLVTASSPEEAEKIARALLDQKKAACVNVVRQINSSYWWQGKLESSQESLLIIKSSQKLLPEIIEVVKKLHSYQVPEIIALPVIGGNPDYLDWIKQTVK